ncbi:hydroxymethylbilane synthase [Rhodoluna lacicola]|jgi:hydroxymethylbilane synthase|uniref:Porphobilinogen deaminase n=1 Tax=Rhodoluna lacicola TaxID=529884 RepID=A0A060JB85_9MICO|nr:hydroxymethylbilane synthase [Rhodoluna lacicola]AIC47111.1 porphobilinogen deaminase [Rhodoluna lacicola]
MPSRTLKLGTRGSLLATTQSGMIADQIQTTTGLASELVFIKTEGDNPSSNLFAPKRPGVFVSALRDALLAGEVDYIVHSFKDLPSAPMPGITLAAIPRREDHRDILISRDNQTLSELATGAVVGTSSPRRAARIRHLRPDLEIKPIRGNIDTRLKKVQDGDFDATILAAAGLNRIGLGEVNKWFFTDAELLPAPAQGALAIECRSGDLDLIAELQKVNHAETELIVTAERAVLRGISASCTTAIGAHAELTDGRLTLTAELSDNETDWHERVSLSLDAASSNKAQSLALGLEIAEQLMQTELGQKIGTPREKSVLLVRATDNELDEAAFKSAGFKVVCDPYLKISKFNNPAGVDRMLEALRSAEPGTWLVITSINSVRFFAEQIGIDNFKAAISNPNLKFAAIGERSAAEIKSLGVQEVLLAEDSNAGALSTAILKHMPKQVILPASNIAMKTLQDAVVTSGVELITEVVYTTETVPNVPLSISALKQGEIDVLVLRSPSAARAVANFISPKDVLALVLVTGNATLEQTRKLGFPRVAMTSETTPDSLVATVTSPNMN